MTGEDNPIEEQGAAPGAEPEESLAPGAEGTLTQEPEEQGPIIEMAIRFLPTGEIKVTKAGPMQATHLWALARFLEHLGDSLFMQTASRSARPSPKDRLIFPR